MFELLLPAAIIGAVAVVPMAVATLQETKPLESDEHTAEVIRLKDLEKENEKKQKEIDTLKVKNAMLTQKLGVATAEISNQIDAKEIKITKQTVLDLKLEQMNETIYSANLGIVSFADSVIKREPQLLNSSEYKLFQDAIEKLKLIESKLTIFSSSKKEQSLKKERSQGNEPPSLGLGR